MQPACAHPAARQSPRPRGRAREPSPDRELNGGPGGCRSGSRGGTPPDGATRRPSRLLAPTLAPTSRRAGGRGVSRPPRAKRVFLRIIGRRYGAEVKTRRAGCRPCLMTGGSMGPLVGGPQVGAREIMLPGLRLNRAQSPSSGCCPASARCSRAGPRRAPPPPRFESSHRRAKGVGLSCALRRYSYRVRPANPVEYLAKISLDCADWNPSRGS